MKKISILPILILSLGCSDQTNNAGKITRTTTTVTYPIHPLLIDNGEEEGWGADIRLSLKKITLTDSFITYKAVSSHEEKNVGLEFILPNNKPGIDNLPTQILTIK